MSRHLLEAAPLKAEIRLSQAISEFGASLDATRKAEFRALRSQSGPTYQSVIQLANTVSQDGYTQHGSSWLAKYGPRVEALLHRIQFFGKAGDILIGGSQNMVASGVWACLKLFLQISIGYIGFFDKMSLAWDRVAHSATIHAKLAELFPKSEYLQKYMCEYLIVVLDFCRKSMDVFKQNILRQVATAVLSFDQHFKDFEVHIEQWTRLINGTVTGLTAELQLDTQKSLVAYNKTFASFMINRKERLALERRETLLEKFSQHQDEFEAFWRRQQKKGSVHWVFQEDAYHEWTRPDRASTLLVHGPLGSGKTVLMANLVKRLHSLPHTPSSRNVVASFFCRFEDSKTLKAGVILRSIAFQILRALDVDDVKGLLHLGKNNTCPSILEILEAMKGELPKHYQYYFSLDALEECEEEDQKEVIDELSHLGNNSSVHFVFSSRNQTGLSKRLAKLPRLQLLTMSNDERSRELSAFIYREVDSRGSRLNLDIEVLEKIKGALSAAAQGMYLWVILQLNTFLPPYDSSMTRNDIILMLESLPEDLRGAYDRALDQANIKRHGARIFKLVFGALRPLKLEELRAALNITPGETQWDANSIELNPHALLSQAGGGLLEFDETTDHVMWIHYSAWMHLLTHDHDHQSDSDHNKTSRCSRHSIAFSRTDAGLEMAMTCVSYLSLNVHDQTIANMQDSRPRLKLDCDIAMGVLYNNVPSNSTTTRFIKSLLLQANQETNYQINLRTALEGLGSLQSRDKSEAFDFLAYSQEFWLEHSRNILTIEWPSDALRDCKSLFLELLKFAPDHVKFPYQHSTKDQEIKWALVEDHDSLFRYVMERDYVINDGMPEQPETMRLVLGMMRSGTEQRALEPLCRAPRANLQTMFCWKVMSSTIMSDVEDVAYLLRLGADPNLGSKWPACPKDKPMKVALSPPCYGADNTSQFARTRLRVISVLLEHGADPVRFEVHEQTEKGRYMNSLIDTFIEDVHTNRYSEEEMWCLSQSDESTILPNMVNRITDLPFSSKKPKSKKIPFEPQESANELHESAISRILARVKNGGRQMTIRHSWYEKVDSFKKGEQQTIHHSWYENVDLLCLIVLILDDPNRLDTPFTSKQTIWEAMVSENIVGRHTFFDIERRSLRRPGKPLVPA